MKLEDEQLNDKVVDIASGAAAENLDNALATGAINEVTVVVQSVSSLISQTQKENFTGKRLGEFPLADKNLPFTLISLNSLNIPRPTRLTLCSV